MKLHFPWFEKPKDNKSVSLTNFVVSAVCLITIGILHCLQIVKDTSIFLEYFTVSAMLYFGRSLNIGGKNYNINDDKKDVQKENT